MLKYVLKRILSALVTIFFIITITFFLMKAIPGNPFAAEKMPNPEIEAAMMAKYGLDQPLWKQYIIYLGNFLRGDFGVSYTKAGLTVNKVIADGFPFSLTIGIYASLVVVFAGILFGSVCALRQYKLIDRFFMVLSTLGSTIPSFVLATGFLFLFSKTLGLVPAFGVDEVAGYIGPVLVIGAFPLSFITRLTRTSLVEVQQQDYIRTARSKGISEFKVIYKHALRSALLPLRAIAAKQGCAVLIVMHSNKKQGVSGRARLADSSDIWDMARSVLMMGRAKNDGKIYLSHEKNSYARPQQTVLLHIDDVEVEGVKTARAVFDGYTDKKDADFIEERRVRTAETRQDTRSAILNVLSESRLGSMPSNELRAAVLREVGCSDGTYNRAYTELIKSGEITKQNLRGRDNANRWYTLYRGGSSAQV